MDCKKALEETQGNFDKAIDYLREKGIAKAASKAGRSTREGVIYSYIHPGNKLGVLVEINCETDFVARNEDFMNFSKDIAMHIAASAPTSVKREEIDPEVIKKEREIYRQQAINEGKPEKILDKIVEGKVEKFFAEVCLMEQPFVKDSDRSVGDIVNDIISKIGENISIKRFSRFRLGE